MTCGIYACVSPSGNRYIGSARNIEKRYKQHRRSLRLGMHHSRSLQRAWNKYGEYKIKFFVVLVCSINDLFFYEQILLDAWEPKYNVSPSASGTRGLKWTEESKDKKRGKQPLEFGRAVSRGMLVNTTAAQRSAIGRLGRAGWTDASRESQISKLKGLKHSIATKTKRSASMVGQFWITDGASNRKLKPGSSVPDGWCRGMTNRGFTGRKHTDETKVKMRGRVVSQVTRDLMRQQKLGKPGYHTVVSKETRDRISNTLSGRARSPEAIAKHRATCALKRFALIKK